MLLPYLVAGLGADVIPDYRAATHMIITQLASRVAMSAELVTGACVRGTEGWQLAGLGKLFGLGGLQRQRCLHGKKGVMLPKCTPKHKHQHKHEHSREHGPAACYSNILAPVMQLPSGMTPMSAPKSTVCIP